jgi:hypothetical protein
MDTMSPSRRNAPARSMRERGVVLLTCIPLIFLIALAASSMALSQVDRIAITEDDTASLQAKLMAESAVDFAMRQLVLDPAWRSPNGTDFSVGEAGEFGVQTFGTGETGGLVMRMTGSADGATAMFQAEVLVGASGPGDLIKSCGLVTLGGDFDANNVDVDAGNVLIVDDENGVLDYDLGADDWVDPGIFDPEITINNFHVEGNLYSFEGVDGPNVSFGAASLVSAPVRTPRFNMEWFLEPNANITVYTASSLKNLTTNKTAVIHVPAGTHITLDNCNFYGGLVVYSEDGYEPRGAHRNTIEWKKCTFGKAVNPGAVPGLGMLAPAAHVTHSHTQNSGYGLFYVKSADHFNAITITAGAVMIVNHVGQMNNVDISYDDSIWEGQFDPFLTWGHFETKLLSLAEYFPD